MSEAAVVRVRILGKWRPGVVLDAGGELWRAAYGTTREPPSGVEFGLCAPDDSCRAQARPAGDDGFQGANTVFERPVDLELTRARCPLDLFFRLRDLVEAHDADVAAGSETGRHDETP